MTGPSDRADASHAATRASNPEESNMVHFDLNQLPITSVAELAARTGYSTRSIQRWKISGVPLHAADAVAIHLGLHPAIVWTDWFRTPEGSSIGASAT